MPKDKEGNKITYSEFFKRWGEGIKNVAKNPTPLEKISIESRATFINLIGLITCLIVLIIYRDKFFVNWFAYGLMLIFIGNSITTGLKFIGLNEQKKFLKGLYSDSQRKEEESEGSNETLLETRSISGEGNKEEQMPEYVENHAEKDLNNLKGGKND